MADIDLSTEQRAEVESVIREVTEMASARLEHGRSSMPIDITAALVLVAMAAHVLATTPALREPAPEPEASDEGASE